MENDKKKWIFQGHALDVTIPSQGLHIVATPIGHLKDITIRALETLVAVDLILCEDTRHSRKLLTRYGITTPLRAYHDHSSSKDRGYILDMLRDGKAIALISDAGMPIIADPGFKLVEDARKQGLDVHICPGASAGLTALCLSALPPHPHLFFGFLSPKKAKRISEITELSEVKSTLIFYESPNRLITTLSDMHMVLGDRQAAVARELTKQFEELQRGRISDLMHHYESNPPKGEIVILVSGQQEKQISVGDVDVELQLAMEAMPLKQAANTVAQRTGLSKRDLYERALVLAGKKHG